MLQQVKAAAGLDQCMFGFTGAAPIMVDTLEYFGQLGIKINEVHTRAHARTHALTAQRSTARAQHAHSTLMHACTHAHACTRTHAHPLES